MNNRNHSSFSIERVVGLLANEVSLRFRSALLVSAVIVSLMMLSHLMQELYNDGGGDSSVVAEWLGRILLIWGVIEACSVFDDMHDRNRMASFLLLPASALEKTTAKFLLVSFVFAAFILALGSVASILCAIVSFLSVGKLITPPALFDADSAATFQTFLVAQSIFFLGSAWFRKSQMTKTALSVLILVLSIFALLIFLVWVFMPDAVFNNPDTSIDFDEFLSDYGDFYLGILEILSTVAFIAVPVICFAIAWMRVREVQLSDGV
ncbi:MAG: hypothetical protein AB8B86_06060 [Pseudomonadales bacterium]